LRGNKHICLVGENCEEIIREAAGDKKIVWFVPEVNGSMREVYGDIDLTGVPSLIVRE
jgi:hypothetical protein